MICSQCGQEVGDATFRRFCGAPIPQADPGQPEAAAPPPQQAAAPQAAPAAPPSNPGSSGGGELGATSLASLGQESMEGESPNAFPLKKSKLLRGDGGAWG